MEGIRWQYAVVNVGMFNASSRLVTVLGSLGAEGWELIHVYDKGSNWVAGLEKGFALFKRPVTDGDVPSEGWAVEIGRDGRVVGVSAESDGTW